MRSCAATFQAYEGNCFLGIDAGSTTTKVALVGEDGSPALQLLQQQQRKHHWRPPSAPSRRSKEMLPENAHIARSCSTGYGEALIKGRPDAGRGRGGDHFPLLRSCILRPGCRLYPGHRRPGHEVHPHQEPYRRQRPAKRGLLLRLRLLHRDLCQVLKLYRRATSRKKRSLPRIRPTWAPAVPCS